MVEIVKNSKKCVTRRSFDLRLVSGWTRSKRLSAKKSCNNREKYLGARRTEGVAMPLW